jgi:hypothetical protein
LIDYDKFKGKSGSDGEPDDPDKDLKTYLNKQK